MCPKNQKETRKVAGCYCVICLFEVDQRYVFFVEMLGFGLSNFSVLVGNSVLLLLSLDIHCHLLRRYD